jgi:hypothetical protein
MANTLNQLRKMRAEHMTRGNNALQGLMFGVPINAKEIAAVTGSAAIAVTAIELLSPVPTTVLTVMAEAGIALAAACGLKSAYQGREFWKAAIMGTSMDKLAKEVKATATKVEEDTSSWPLDSNLKPVRNRCAPWTRPQEAVDEFMREHGTDIIH